jgi:hypothetical protein
MLFPLMYRKIKVVGNIGKTNNVSENTIYKTDVKQSLRTFSQIGLIWVRGFSRSLVYLPNICFHYFRENLL